MRITHVVVTSAFAGTERYVVEVARRQAERGHDVRVLGGHEDSMSPRLGRADWKPAPSVAAACRVLLADGRRDIVHSHLTYAETAAVLTAPLHQARIVTTRHIAGRRGTTALGAILAPFIARRVDVEIAISAHVAAAAGGHPRVLRSGVARSGLPYDVSSRMVLVLQRLEAEKDTTTALLAWKASGLAERGWHLHVAGDGEQKQELSDLVERHQIADVHFLGRIEDPDRLLARAAVLLAPTPNEGLGLGVLEAMAHGVPVVLAASGGHLETAPLDWPWFFPPGDATAAGQALARLAGEPERLDASRQVRQRQRQHFDIDGHVDALLDTYAFSPAARRGPRR